MNVRKIVEEYLREHGFDGLYYPGECGCDLENLMPCMEFGAMGCVPGYYCEPTSSEYDFCIGPKEKPTKEES